MATTPAAPPVGISNRELIQWVFERVNDHDVESLRQVWTDGTVDHFPNRTCRGGDEIAAYFQETFAGVPDFHAEIVALAEEGEDVFVHWHLTGTHDGPLMGFAPTGKRLAIDGIDHFVVRDGHVSTAFVIFDQMAYARQLGVMPADGSVPDRLMKGAFNAVTKLVRRLRR